MAPPNHPQLFVNPSAQTLSFAHLSARKTTPTRRTTHQRASDLLLPQSLLTKKAPRAYPSPTPHLCSQMVFCTAAPPHNTWEAEESTKTKWKASPLIHHDDRRQNPQTRNRLDIHPHTDTMEVALNTLSFSSRPYARYSVLSVFFVAFLGLVLWMPVGCTPPTNSENNTQADASQEQIIPDITTEPDPSNVCSAHSCTPTCITGKCPSCSKSGACNATCEGGGCQMICAGSSDCNFDCSGGKCEQRCEDTATCKMNCSGGGCTQVCKATNKSCEKTCTGANCL